MAVQHDSPLDLDELFRCLREHRMIETEACARREYRSFVTPSADTNASLVNGIDVEDYYAIFAGLTDFVSQSPYQIELTQFLFPVFVHLYFNLLENGRLDECRHFYAQFIRCTPLESLHGHFFYHLRLISHSSTHLDRSPLMRTMRASRFFLRLSMTSCTATQTFMDATKSHSKSNLTATQISLLLAICQQCLKVDVNKQVFSPCTVVRYQTMDQPMTPLFVHTTVADAIRFTRLYTGIFPLQSAGPIDHLIAVPCASAYPQINYNRLPNSAEGNPVPRLGPHQLPCICMFTLKSAKQLINCVTLSDDCHLLAIGCQSSEILVCSLNPNKTLHSMKSARDLRSPATERCNERVLIGHTAAIFTLAFQPDKRMYLLSGSQDCTLRLWHLSTWTCLVVYRMHSQPILDAVFASTGSTFASCSTDGLLGLWAVDKIYPCRIYPEHGHTGPIHLVEFHPNANYLASAHSDHTIHLWNVHHENALVRIFNGHRSQLSALRFSPNGHFLASGCWQGEFILWDIQNNSQIAHLVAHEQAISSIEFSPLTGTLLLIASIDGSVSLWNCFMITKIYDEKLTDANDTTSPSSKGILLNVFRTKNTPVLHIRFSKENILYAIGLCP